MPQINLSIIPTYLFINFHLSIISFKKKINTNLSQYLFTYNKFTHYNEIKLPYYCNYTFTIKLTSQNNKETAGTYTSWEAVK